MRLLRNRDPRGAAWTGRIHPVGRKLGQQGKGDPLLAEQRRIVAKVDQLMFQVDQLETQLAASRATVKNLLEAVVAELTVGCSLIPTPPPGSSEWRVPIHPHLR